MRRSPPPDPAEVDLPVGRTTHAVVQAEAALRALEEAWSCLFPEDDGRAELDEAMLEVRKALDVLRENW